MCPCGKQTEADLSKKLTFVPADKEIKEIVDQGVFDFEVDKPAIAFKHEIKAGERAIVTSIEPMNHKKTGQDFYVIKYSPYKDGAMANQKPIRKQLFLFNQDLAVNAASLDQPIASYESVHVQAKKFEIYHELAHAKNGDLDKDSYLNDQIKSARIDQKVILCLGGLASALFAWKSSSAPKTKCMIIAGIATASLALVNRLYYGIMAYHQHKELMADALACGVLIVKRDPKPIIHRIIEMSLDRDYKTWDGKTDNSAENMGSTHPTELERINLCFAQLRNSGFIWTHELYEEIKKELEEDEYSALKLIYLDELYQSFLILQNRNPFALSWQKEKYKKNLARSVLEGYFPGSEFARVVKWKKR
jgi:hypothetical protein